MKLVSPVVPLFGFITLILLTMPIAYAYEPFEPIKIALDGEGNIYTSVAGNLSVISQLYVYSPDGREIRTIPKGTTGDFAVNSGGDVFLLENRTIFKIGTDGTRNTFWEADKASPADLGWIATDSAGNIYVSDYRIDYEAATGRAEPYINGSHIIVLDCNGTFLKTCGGTPDMPLNTALRISAGKNGTIYATDLSNRIFIFSPDGNLTTMGKLGSENGTFSMITDIEPGQDGYLYVTEYGNRRVQKLYPNGTFVAQWAGCGPDSFIYPSSVAADDHGRVYVTDGHNQRLVWLDGNNYTYGTNKTANVAGKGVLWDSVVAGDNYTVMRQKIAAEDAAAEMPGFTYVTLAMSLIVLLGIVRLRK